MHPARRPVPAAARSDPPRVPALQGAVLLYRSRLRRLGRLQSGAPTDRAEGRPADARPLLAERVAFACLLVFCLTLPSNWTQDVPARYGARHRGLTHSWVYPAIDTSPRSP